ncbi:hypothetical protein [Brevibacterium gallinarum]|uniref:Uncharacterized protein n=1 Tax=Brevibacterium gallinarum TaxID=2762220 RepID=A0ABR8WVJ2_9MICO|nr:hypothetical protein [Brevibacterium gallinarum]MBD8020661.1 hypothetical protein [Brevibacterium gallinarum]
MNRARGGGRVARASAAAIVLTASAAGCTGSDGFQPRPGLIDDTRAAIMLSIPQLGQKLGGQAGALVLVHADGTRSVHRTGGIETGTVASADGHIFYSDAEHDYVLSDELVTYDHPEPESMAMATIPLGGDRFATAFNVGAGDHGFEYAVTTNAPGELKRHVLRGEFTSLSNCDGTLSVVVSESSIERDIPRDTYLTFTPDGSGVAAEQLHDYGQQTDARPSERISTIQQTAQPCYRGSPLVMAHLDETEAYPEMEFTEAINVRILDAGTRQVTDHRVEGRPHAEVGSELERTDLIAPVTSAAVVDDDDLLTVNSSGHVWQVDLRTGEPTKLHVLPDVEPGQLGGAVHITADHITHVAADTEAGVGPELRMYDTRTGSRVIDPIPVPEISEFEDGDDMVVTDVTAVTPPE